MPEPDDEQDLDEFLGVWEVEGDRYTVAPSSTGGLLATSDLSGDPISPAWVILRGQRVQPPE